MKSLKSLTLLTLLVSLLSISISLGATRTTTTTGGNWNTTSTWSGGVVPASGDAAVIVAGASVTVTTNTTVNSILFNNANANTASLTVNAGVVLTVSTGITNQNGAARNTAATIQGPGTLNCASISVGGTTTPGLTSSAFTATLTSAISNLSISGNLTIKALYNSSLSAANQGTFALGSGSVSVGGTVVFVTVPLFGPILTLATGSQNGTLKVSSSTPFSTIGGGTSTFAMANSALVLTNVAAMPATPISFFSLTNTSFQLCLANSATNAVVSALTTGGAQNQINIASLPGIFNTPRQFTLLNYSGSIGGAGFNFVLGNLPGGVGAYLSNNLSQSSVDLVVTNVFPSELALTSINGGASPTTDHPFSVVVQARDGGGIPRTVATDTTVTLGLNTGSGILGGNLTGTILAGTSSLTISGVTYTKAESGVSLTATNSTGDTLTPGNSATFTVQPGAFSKLQLLLPGEVAAPGSTSGKTGSPAMQTVGITFNVTVKAVDANWNPLSTNDSVHISSSDANALLSPNAPLSAGTGVFSVTLLTAGLQTLMASDVTDPVIVSSIGPAVTANLGSQTITFPSPGNQTYGVTPITFNATTSSGLMVSYGVTSGPAAVTGNTLTITGAGLVTIQASQPGNANWSPASPIVQTISVAPKPVTGSIVVSNKPYDGSMGATIVSRMLTGVINGDNVSLTGGTASFANKTVGVAKIASATGLGLSGPSAASYVLASTNASAAADITPVILTVSGITANNKIYNGTNAATLNTGSATLVGVVAGDNVNLVTGPAFGTFADKMVGTGKTVTVSGLSLGAADKNNYTLSQPTTAADITVRTLTVTATGMNKAYDGTSNATVTFSDNRVLGDLFTISSATASFANSSVGTNKTVTVSGITTSGTASANYVANSMASTTADIMPATLTITANDTNRLYRAINPAFTASYSGFVNGEDASVLNGSPLFITSADTNSPVGSYPIQSSQGTLANANYSFNLLNGTLRITEGPATISIKFIAGTGGQADQITLGCGGRAPGGMYHISASVDLVQWTEIGAVQAQQDGTVTFSDSGVTAFSMRFYRLVGN